MIKEYYDPKLESVAAGQPIYDYSALESLAEFKEVAGNAAVILAINKLNGSWSIVYGKELLNAIAHKVIPSQGCKIAMFAIDFDEATDELEHLIAAVQVTFGFNEYDG